MAILIERKRGIPCEVVNTQEQLVQILNDASLATAIRLIRECRADAESLEKTGQKSKAKDKLAQADSIKRNLPGFIFSCMDFKDSLHFNKRTLEKTTGKYRKQDCAELNGLFMVDYDHIDDPRALWKELLQKGIEKEWNPFFVFVTSSLKGLKIVMPTKLECGNLASNQNAFAKWSGHAVDTNTKDASRLSFAPCMADVLLMKPELLTYFNKDYYEKYNGKYSDGSSDADIFTDTEFVQPGNKPDGAGNSDDKSAGDSGSSDTDATDAPEEQPYQSRIRTELRILAEGGKLSEDSNKERITYRGLKIRDLINAYFGGKAPEEGTRHHSLLELASDLRYLLEFNKENCVYYILRLPFVQDLYKEGDDVAQDIEDGFAYKTYRYFPKRVTAAISACMKSADKPDGAETEEQETARKFGTFGEKFLSLAQYFPTMNELISTTRTSSVPAIIFSAGAMYGTLATRCWYYFYHNPEKMRRLNYEIFIIADPANGKSSIGDLYQTIMAPIMADDAIFNQSINDYKKKVKEHATKSDKNKKDGLVYPTVKTRIHGSRTANNIFIEDMVNNVEDVDGVNLHLHLFTFDAELDSADIANKGGQWIDKSIFELKAFHNEEDNQQYRNVDSVTGPFDVYWNFIYTGTPYSLSKKITKRNFGSGLSTRLAVIPLCAPKFKMMPFRKKSKKNLQVIQVISDWAFKLHEVKGELPFWPLVEHSWRWVDSMMKLAEASNDETMDLFIRRIPYYGINVAAPFIIMRHYKEFKEKKTFKIDEHDKALCSLVMEIQYYSQRKYFSKFASIYWENRDSEAALNTSRKTVTNNYLIKMPDIFTYQSLCEQNAIKEDYARMLVKRWEQQGLVVHRGRGKDKMIYKTKDGLLI